MADLLGNFVDLEPLKHVRGFEGEYSWEEGEPLYLDANANTHLGVPCKIDVAASDALFDVMQLSIVTVLTAISEVKQLHSGVCNNEAPIEVVRLNEGVVRSAKSG